MAPVIGPRHTHPRSEARTPRGPGTVKRADSRHRPAALQARQKAPSLVTPTLLTCLGLSSRPRELSPLPKSSLTGIPRRAPEAPTRGPLLQFLLRDLTRFLAPSCSPATRRSPSRKAGRNDPSPHPGRPPRPEEAASSAACRLAKVRRPAEQRVARQVNAQMPPALPCPRPPRRAAARRSRLTRRRRALSAPPGRPARSGLCRPSPCGPRRGLPLPGGASLLQWERPAGQGGTRAFPRPERGWPRVGGPPEPPQPRAGPPPECASTCGPRVPARGRRERRRREEALQPPPRGAD